MENKSNPSEQRSSFLSLPVITAIFVLLFLLVVFMYGRIRDTSKSVALNGQTNVESTKERTVVFSGNLAAAGAKDSLPAGFPTDLPLVEATSVKESLKVEYPEKDVTQYSVTYLSSATVSAVSSEYDEFFKKNGYTIKSSSTPSQFYITKNGDDLSVVIETTDTGETRVFLVYLDRK